MLSGAVIHDQLMEMYYMGNVLNIWRISQIFPQAVRALNSTHPAPLWNPYKPFLLKQGPSHPPQPCHVTEKTETFLCIRSVLHRWVGLYQPPVTHSPVFALDTFHTLLLCVHNGCTHKRLNSICMFTCSCTTITLHCSPQLLDLRCFLCCTCIHLKLSYSLYSLYFLVYV